MNDTSYSQIGRVDLLVGTNYHIWSIKLKAILRAKRLFKCIIENDPPPVCDDVTSPEGKARQVWEDQNAEAFSIIILSLSPSQAGMFAEEENARNVWMSLEKMYSGNKEDRIIDAILELKNLSMYANESVDCYFTRVKNIISKVNVLGGNISSRELIFYVIRGIHAKLENIAVILRTRRDIGLDEAHQILKEEEGRMNVMKTKCGLSDGMSNLSLEGAYKTKVTRHARKSGSRAYDKTCYICHKKGHIARECWHKRDNGNIEQRRTSAGSRDRNNIHRHGVNKNSARTATNGRDCEQYISEETKIECRNNDDNERKNTYWNLDSGCSVHMTAHAENLFNIKEYSSDIKMAESDREIKAIGKGEMRMTVKVGSEDVNLRMKNVLYVPDLRDNLMSVKELVKQGNEVRFNKKGAEVCGPSGRTIAVGKEKDGMYLVHGKITMNSRPTGSECACESNESKQDKIKWHRRLGHINQSYMQLMKDNRMVDGLIYNNVGHIDCEECVMGKLSQKPFKSVLGENTRRPLELLHMDLCGPMPIESLGGKRFIFVIVDSFTRRIFVDLLKHKSDAFEAFTKFQTRRENEMQVKIQRVRSDNGGEFVNRKFNELFLQKGIRHERTVAYSPQSNGTAERANRSLLDMARTMLIDAKLPTKFWGEAIHAAAYIQNCSYRKSAGKKTPMEKWTREKPKVGHFRTFGCLAYYWRHKVFRNKLEPRALPGIFVGYSRTSKAYRIYITETGKVIESRNVKFIEDKRGVEIRKMVDVGSMELEEIRYETANMDIDETSNIEEIEWKDMDLEEIENTAVTTKPNFTWTGTHEDIPQEDQINQDDEQDHRVDDVENIRQDENREEIVERQRGRPKGTHKGVVANREKRHKEEREILLREQGVRRSQRVRNIEAANQVKERVFTEIPDTYEDAVRSEYRQEWQKAMDDEMQSLSEHKVWNLVKRPEGRKVLKNRWVFNVKKDSKGNVNRFKARLVVMGNNQKKGRDYEDSYAPVIKGESLRVLIAIAAKFKLEIKRCDVKTAYLHGELKEEIYMEQPIGAEDGTNKVCRLLKSLYGLPQSGKDWNEKLNRTMIDIGFKRLDCEPSLYIIRNDKEFVIVGVYVDDCIIIGTEKQWTDTIVKEMKKKFEMREEDGDGIFLGVEIRKTKDGYKIRQSGQIKKLLESYGMDDCKPVKIPMDTNQKLEEYEISKVVDQSKYRELIGSLMYVAGGTRPDITFAVNKLAQFCKDPREIHWTAGKRILRYLKGTIEMELHYGNRMGQVEACSDASWSASVESRSQTGYCVNMGDALITWKSRKQELVALSTCEAEINAICETVKEMEWLKNVFDEIGMGELVQEPLKVYTDSKAAIDWSKSKSVKQRTKHFNRKMYKIREAVEEKRMELIFKASEDLEADILTKAVSERKLRDVCLRINLK